MNKPKTAITSFAKAHNDPTDYLFYLYDDLQHLGFTEMQNDEIIALWEMAKKELSFHEFFEFHTFIHPSDTRASVSRRVENLSYKLAEKLGIPIAPLEPACATVQYQHQSWLAPRPLP